MKRISVRKKKSENQNEGSALLIAIIIMMVVMMLSLALLLVSYSLAAVTGRQNQTEQCREIAQSLSVEIQQELETPQFKTQADWESADEDQFPLWFYVRYNVLQSSWPYFSDEGEPRHGEDYAYRYFKLKKAPEELDDLSIIMYWQPDDKENRLGGVTLYVQVSCKIGKQTAVITTPYSLVIEDFDNREEVLNANTQWDGGEDKTSKYNPQRSRVYLNERWTWRVGEDRG